MIANEGHAYPRGLLYLGMGERINVEASKQEAINERLEEQEIKNIRKFRLMLYIAITALILNLICSCIVIYMMSVDESQHILRHIWQILEQY